MVVFKVNVKDNVNDGEIDLSMLDLQDVPVREIASVKKAHGLDLSNNHLTILPKTFPLLVNLIKIDLSRNELKELPDNFGDLVKLKHLDLYKNQLQHLPLSFSKLTVLKWLDLKDNPLVPSIAEVAGHCLDAKQCQKCAKDIVALYSKLQVKVDEERKLREEQRQKSYEENAEKLKQEKKAKKTKLNKKQEKTLEKVEVPKMTVNTEVKKVKSKSTKKSSGGLSFVLKFFGIITLLLAFISISVKVKYGLLFSEAASNFVLKCDIPLELKERLVMLIEYLTVVEGTLYDKGSHLVGHHNVNIVWNAFTGVYHNVTKASNEFYLKIFGK